MQVVLISIFPCQKGSAHQTDKKITKSFFSTKSLLSSDSFRVPYCSCRHIHHTNTVQSYCPKSNTVFLTSGCQKPLNF